MNMKQFGVMLFASFLVGASFATIGWTFFTSNSADLRCGQVDVTGAEQGFYGDVGRELWYGNLSYTFDIDDTERIQEHLDWLENNWWDYGTDLHKGKIHLNATCVTEQGR